MGETIEQAVLHGDPAEILVITLPNSSIKSNTHKQAILPYLHKLPIQIPESVWRIGMCFIKTKNLEFCNMFIF